MTSPIAAVRALPNPALEAAIKRAREWLDSLTPEERAEHFRCQRESWVRAELSWPAPRFQWVDGVKVYESYEDYCNA